MDEQRNAAYLQLIQKLLECPSGEEGQVLIRHLELLDPGCLKIMIQTAQYFANIAKLNQSNFFTNLALQLGEVLGDSRETKEIRKQTADILLQWGIEQFNIRQFSVSLKCWSQCFIIYRGIHDNIGEANSLRNLGEVHRDLGEYEKAINFDERALAISQEIGYRQGEAISIGGLGNSYYFLREYEKAIDFHKQHLAISREIKDHQGEAYSLANLGNAYDSLGEYEQAIDFQEQCLTISRKIGYRQGEANSLRELGQAYRYLGKYEKVIDFHQQYLAISREIKDRQGEAISLRSLGSAYRSLGEYERAISYQQKSLAISREIKDRQGEAYSLANLGNAYDSLGKYEKAIDFHEKSLAISQEIKDRRGEANSLGGLGNAYCSLGKYKQAIDFHEKSLAISREIKDRQGEAYSLGGLGNAYCSLGKYKQAIDFHEKSLAISREIKDRQGEAISLGNLGNALESLGEYELAISYHQKHLAISRETKDRRGEAGSLGNLGNAYYLQGEYELAISYHKQHLTISREIKDRQGEATSLGNLGNVYNYLGEYEKAIDFHQQHLVISQRIKDRRGEANSLGGLGNAYCCLGKYKQAIDFHEKSLAISQEIKHRKGEATSLGNLGVVYDSLGEYELAISYHKQHLAVSQKINYRLGEAMSLGNLGNAYYFLEEYKKAIGFHEKSLDISREITDRQGEAMSLNYIGNAYRELQQMDVAIHNYQESLKIATPKTMPVECARNSTNLGNLHFTQGNWHKAIATYTKAIKATEILRTGRQTDYRRQEILKNAISVYANIIQSFVNTRQYTQAFTYAEQSRNRQLVDLMYSKDVYYQEETPPEVAELLQQYEQIQRQIDNLRFNNESPNYNQEIVGAANPGQISASWQVRNDLITTLEADKQKMYRQIRKLDRVLAEGLAVTPLEFAQLQNLVRDKTTTAIVSFFSTDEDTYAFILVGDRVDLHHCGHSLDELQMWLWENWLRPYLWSGKPDSDRPPLSTIAAAKLLGCEINTIESAKPERDKVTVFLKDGSSQSVDKAEFNKLRKQLLSIYDWHQQMPSNLKEISQRLQLDKLLEKLTGIQELIIIPHLYLHQIPFAALPLADNQYLGDKFLIRTQSSCQTLDFCTQRPPISTETPAYGIVEDTQEDLPCSSFEAQKVAQIYNVAPDKYLQGTTATVSTYKQLLQQVQGLLSSHHAKSRFDNSLESELILADGRITLSDLLSPAFRFPDLDEVFLSACETNLGTTEITDDTMTLNTGFLCAGARGVISSLWAVDDLATSLFSLFYHQKRKAGLNRPQALQKAQQDLRHLTGKEFEREYYRELEQLLNEKLQLASQKKAAAKQKLDGCAEDAPEYEQLQAEYKKREWLEERILITRDIRLKAVCEQEHPFEHPEYWSGFICAGLR